MDLPDFLDVSHCRVDQRFSGKEACLGDLARRAAALLEVEAGPIFEALRHRESLGSTGLGAGIALPHARLSFVLQPFVLVTRLREAIPFDAVDDKPVDLVCLVLLPASERGEQLVALACVARRLRSPTVICAVRKANDAQTVRAALTR